MAILFSPQEIASTLSKEIQLEVTEVAENFLKEVVPNTRVRTGLARGNWRVRSPRPDNRPVRRVDPGGRRTISEGVRRLRQVRARGRFQPVYVQNLVPYIGVLNALDGLFVDRAILNAAARGQSGLKEI